MFYFDYNPRPLRQRPSVNLDLTPLPVPPLTCPLSRRSASIHYLLLLSLRRISTRRHHNHLIIRYPRFIILATNDLRTFLQRRLFLNSITGIRKNHPPPRYPRLQPYQKHHLRHRRNRKMAKYPSLHRLLRIRWNPPRARINRRRLPPLPAQ
jgi:hypothetical protein